MREALTLNRSKLNTQATLDGMLDILVRAAPGAGIRPAACTSARRRTPPRLGARPGTIDESRA